MSARLTGVEALEQRLAAAETTIVPYLTGGYPTMGGFVDALAALSAEFDAIEIGIPFSDPMADGATIQESSRVALEEGASVDAILTGVESLGALGAELIVMSYLNPLMAYRLEDLVPRLAGAGVSALVVPDLPLEESGELTDALGPYGIGLVQLVSPVTSPQRLELLGRSSQGFTYAVTMAGTTGGHIDVGEQVTDYLDLVKDVSRVPVLAGFGVRSAAQVQALAPHCDGVIVGSALVEVLGSGGDPVSFLAGLRP